MIRITCAIIAAFLLSAASVPLAIAEPAADARDSLEQLFDGFPDEQKEQIISDLIETGEHTRFFSKKTNLELLPDLPIREDIRRSVRELEPRIGMEALFLAPLPDPSASEAEKALYIYNTMLSVSTMQGINYYSASRERDRLLFARSHFVASVENEAPIPDPRVTVIPERLDMTVLQEDLTFGENFYGMRYIARGDAVLVTMENLTVMKYGIFPVLKKQNLQIYLIAVPLDRHVLFYGGFGAKVPAIPFLEEKAKNSFYNRIVALYRWFGTQLNNG